VIASLIVGAASKSSGSSFGFIFIILIAFVVIYLIVVRPQRRKQNQQRQQASQLQVGDEVLTAGGLYGRVTSLGDDEVRVEIAPKVEVRLARRAIAAVLTEHDAPEPAAEEPEDESEERWQSAFDDGSDEEKPG
jgi:preprotein translocase subunit YajC